VPLDKQVPQHSAHFTAYFGGVIKFFNSVLHPNVRYINDLYPYMFLCDVICLLVATFGYSSFGVDTGSGNILSDVTNNRIPVMFVLLILVLTVLMVCAPTRTHTYGTHRSSTAHCIYAKRSC
jgi:hypothetical protein